MQTKSPITILLSSSPAASKDFRVTPPSAQCRFRRSCSASTDDDLPSPGRLLGHKAALSPISTHRAFMTWRDDIADNNAPEVIRLSSSATTSPKRSPLRPRPSQAHNLRSPHRAVDLSHSRALCEIANPPDRQLHTSRKKARTDSPQGAVCLEKAQALDVGIVSETLPLAFPSAASEPAQNYAAASAKQPETAPQTAATDGLQAGGSGSIRPAAAKKARKSAEKVKKPAKARRKAKEATAMMKQAIAKARDPTAKAKQATALKKKDANAKEMAPKDSPSKKAGPKKKTPTVAEGNDTAASKEPVAKKPRKKTAAIKEPSQIQQTEKATRPILKRQWTPVKDTVPCLIIPDSEDDGEGMQDAGKNFNCLLESFRCTTAPADRTPGEIPQVFAPLMEAGAKPARRREKSPVKKKVLPKTLTERAVANCIVSKTDKDDEPERASTTVHGASREQDFLFGTSSQLRNDTTQEVRDFNTAVAQSRAASRAATLQDGDGSVKLGMWDLAAVEDATTHASQDSVCAGPLGAEVVEKSGPLTKYDFANQSKTVFPRITETVKSQPPSGNHDVLSWYDKMLLYDPIVLEDFTAWLNKEGLTWPVRNVVKPRKRKRTKKDDEISGVSSEVTAGSTIAGNKDLEAKPATEQEHVTMSEEPLEIWMVQRWCESMSVCCLRREGVRGGQKLDY